jgi:hypothetical protein
MGCPREMDEDRNDTNVQGGVWSPTPDGGIFTWVVVEWADGRPESSDQGPLKRAQRESVFCAEILLLVFVVGFSRVPLQNLLWKSQIADCLTSAKRSRREQAQLGFGSQRQRRKTTAERAFPFVRQYSELLPLLFWAAPPSLHLHTPLPIHPPPLPKEKKKRERKSTLANRVNRLHLLRANVPTFQHLLDSDQLYDQNQQKTTTALNGAL